MKKQCGPRFRRRAVRLLSIGAVGAVSAFAYGAEPQNGDFAEFSLEQLENIQITSVARHAESLQDAAASIYVISADDIRRSGATTLPEALRLAPNLEVARINASQYAISARGFNNAIGNKLLVLIDGRTVYTPLYSGVFWDAQDVMLEDVDRIEVISGPGATLWGANAVNGVINIITKSAQDTQGGLLAAGGGNREVDGAVRYGGQLGANGHYRVYANGSNQFNTEQTNGTAVADRFDRGQTGFRLDWGNGKTPDFTLQGDAYYGETQVGPTGINVNLGGANLLGRWNRQLANGSNVQLQAYYDHADRNDPVLFGADSTDTFDIEFQHEIPLTKQRFLWGAGYRYAIDVTEPYINISLVSPTLQVQFLPDSRRLHWANLFVQDEIQLSESVALTLGAKVETNIYTGAEFMPDVRLAWKATDNQLIWGAVSRAVREPARLDRDFYLSLFVPVPIPILHRTIVLNFPVIQGGPDFQSETANVFQIGHRAQWTDALSSSITLYYNFYNSLRSGQPPPAFIQNMMSGTTRGIEAWSNYQVTHWWRLSAGLTLEKEQLGINPGSTDPTGPSALGDDPAQQWILRSAFNFGPHELDVTVRHVNALPNPAVPDYTAVDARWGWQVRRNLELSLTVQNLFDPEHIEFNAPATASEIDRSVFFKALWHL